MDLRQTYNRIAADWHRNHVKDDWWVNGTDKFISLLPPGAQVLDAGCGGGMKSRYLQSHGLTVTGIDFSEGLIAIAKREVPDIDFRVLDIHQVDELSEKFDGIFLQAVLLHLPRADVVPVLKKMLAQLKPGGLIYVAVKGQRPGGVPEETKTENDYGYDYQRFFSYFTPAEVEGWWQPLGCEILYTHQVEVGHTTWMQVMAKPTSTIN